MKSCSKILYHITVRKIKPNNVKLKATISIYDALGELPLSKVSYVNVLKPLIDLELVSLTRNSWLNVSISI